MYKVLNSTFALLYSLFFVIMNIYSFPSVDTHFPRILASKLTIYLLTISSQLDKGQFLESILYNNVMLLGRAMHGQVEDHFERMIHDRTVRARRDGSADSILSQKGIRIGFVARVSFCFRRKKRPWNGIFCLPFFPTPSPLFTRAVSLAVFYCRS